MNGHPKARVSLSSARLVRVPIGIGRARTRRSPKLAAALGIGSGIFEEVAGIEPAMDHCY